MKQKQSLRPFWAYVFLFKTGAGLHYALLSVLGARIMPLWLVGLLIGGGALVQLVCDVPAGRLLDRFGYVRLLRWSTLAFVISGLVLAFGLTPTTYVLSLALAIIGWLFFGPGANAYMLAVASRETAGRQLGFYHAVSSAGVVVSSLALPFVVMWGAPATGLLLGVLLASATIASWLTVPEPASVHKEPKVKRHTYYVRRHVISDLFTKLGKLNPASTLLILQNVAGGIFYASIWFAIPILIEQQTEHGLWSVGLSVFDLAVVLLGSLFGRLADRRDRKRLVFCGLLVFAVAGMFTGLNLTAWFLLFGFLATAGDELSSVSLWAWLDELDESHSQDGLVNGAIIFASDLGWAIGPMLAGVTYGIYGPSWTIAGLALPLFLVWIVAIVFFRRLPRIAPATEAPPRRRFKH